MLRIIKIFALFFIINLLAFSHGKKFSLPRNNVGVVGGEPVNIEEFPYMVSIQGDDEHFCGGAIIHERFILTAAHCSIFLGWFDKAVVKVGANVCSNGTVYEIEDEYANEKYEMFENAHDYDIALLKLKEPIVLGNSVKIGEFIDPDMKFDDNTEFNITGWGVVQHGGGLSTQLLRSLVPFVNEETCKEDYKQGEEITERMICAGGEGHDACQGDSGGPLSYQGKIVGVVSGGKDCARAEYPTVYTKVSSFTDWISTTIEANSS